MPEMLIVLIPDIFYHIMVITMIKVKQLYIAINLRKNIYLSIFICSIETIKHNN